jgi:hypothetical protein
VRPEIKRGMDRKNTEKERSKIKQKERKTMKEKKKK